MAFLRVILGVSVSGQKSLATARDAGADITDAVNKWVDETCDFRRKCQFRYSFSVILKTNDPQVFQEKRWSGTDSVPEMEAWKSSVSQVSITLRVGGRREEFV